MCACTAAPLRVRSYRCEQQIHVAVYFMDDCDICTTIESWIFLTTEEGFVQGALLCFKDDDELKSINQMTDTGKKKWNFIPSGHGSHQLIILYTWCILLIVLNNVFFIAENVGAVLLKIVSDVAPVHWQVSSQRNKITNSVGDLEIFFLQGKIYLENY